MNKIKTFALIAVVSAAMTSCLSDDDGEQRVKFGYSNNFSYVVDTHANTTEGEMLEGALYAIDMDLSNGIADLTVSNLTVSSSMSRISFSMPGLTYKVVNGATVINVPEYVVESSGERHTISNFTLSYLPRLVSGGVDASAYKIVFVVDNRWVVRVVQKAMLLYGDTNVTDVETGATGKLTNPIPFVGYDLDYKLKKATFYIYNIAFDNTVYSTVQLKNVPFAIDSKGITISSDQEITPIISGGDAEKNKVKNFSAVCSYDPEMTLGFLIADKYSVSGKYNLTGEIKTSK